MNSTGKGVARRIAILGIFASVVAGCSRNIQDEAAMEAIRSGQQKMLQNPSRDLTKWLLSHKDAATSIEELWLSEADLTDSKLAYFADLAQLPTLRGVRFHNTQNTDSFVPKLSHFSNLDSLAFYETDLSTDGLGQVAKLSQLKELRIEFQSKWISSAGLAQLKTLRGLKKLELAHDVRFQISGLQSLLPSCEIQSEYIPAGQWGTP